MTRLKLKTKVFPELSMCSFEIKRGRQVKFCLPRSLAKERERVQNLIRLGILMIQKVVMVEASIIRRRVG
jgi:hypothetical protein